MNDDDKRLAAWVAFCCLVGAFLVIVVTMILAPILANAAPLPAQITRKEVNVRIVEIDGERFAVLAERDLLGIVSAADDLAAEVAKRKACGWL